MPTAYQLEQENYIIEYLKSRDKYDLYQMFKDALSYPPNPNGGGVFIFDPIETIQHKYDIFEKLVKEAELQFHQR